MHKLETNSLLLDEVLLLIEEKKFCDAVDRARAAAATHPGPETEALLGLAFFHWEKYAEAAEHYARALTASPGNAGWEEMLARAKANAVAEIHVPVPDFIYFERGQLLAPPRVPEGALPSPDPPKPRTSAGRSALRMLGNTAGALGTFLMHHLTRLWGKFAGYRDDIWTNWYRRQLHLGVLTLAHMRERLNAHNLKNTYPAGQLTGFTPHGLVPPEGVTHFRTADGSWNNLQNPREGAAGTRFTRNVTRDAMNPETGPALMTPNPREVSRVLLTRSGEMKEVPFLNLLSASWIQFMNHDWINHGEILQNDVIEIPLAPDDPARKQYWQTKMFIGRTQPDPTRMPDRDEPPVTFINEVTHWWDGSQIYGSDQPTVDRLRSHAGGKLRMSDDGTLPVDSKGLEETGFNRNWWIGLTMLHTLFAKEHNAICGRLRNAYPQWSDGQLFNVARLINAAVTAKIHSVEWTPSILPNPGLSAGLHANWYGLLTMMLRSPGHRKTVADINVRNPELGGVVGNPINKHGQPFGLTEEFVEVYRLHSLLPETLRFRKIGAKADPRDVDFRETRQAGSRKITSRMAMSDLFFSFGTQHPGQLVLNNFPRFMQELSIPGNPLFDMGAVDILRARERGVPRYNEFRRQLGLNPIRSFDDLTDDLEAVAKLRQVYGDRPEDVEKLDLMIGTLAEGHRPTGFGFGETMFQIFILNATRRLQADRFYTDAYNEEVYTPEGLKWIDDATLKSVLLRHYPELQKTGLVNVKNAFEPWDETDRLDPERHPLRGFDKDLRPDPWVPDIRRRG